MALLRLWKILRDVRVLQIDKNNVATLNRDIVRIWSILLFNDFDRVQVVYFHKVVSCRKFVN